MNSPQRQRKAPQIARGFTCGPSPPAPLPQTARERGERRNRARGEIGQVQGGRPRAGANEFAAGTSRSPPARTAPSEAAGVHWGRPRAGANEFAAGTSRSPPARTAPSEGAEVHRCGDRAGANEFAATTAESPANCAGLHLRNFGFGAHRLMVHGQSAKADFAPFQRRIHSLLDRRDFAPVHLLRLRRTRRRRPTSRFRCRDAATSVAGAGGAPRLSNLYRALVRARLAHRNLYQAPICVRRPYTACLSFFSSVDGCPPVRSSRSRRARLRSSSALRSA
jgi:hypothetical protein